MDDKRAERLAQFLCVTKTRSTRRYALKEIGLGGQAGKRMISRGLIAIVVLGGELTVNDPIGTAPKP
jgi:hypothetical protein